MTREAPAATEAAAERVVPQSSAPRDRAPRDFRSDYANPRDDDARLHWPPTKFDYELDTALEEVEQAVEREVRQEAWRKERSRAGGRAETREGAARDEALEGSGARGFSTDAKQIFDEELERQLVDLVLLITLEAPRR